MSMMLKGRAWKFGDDVNTDLIMPGKYLELVDPKEIARHAMEGADPTFVERVGVGDIVVGGRNFGCGSSREQAPVGLKQVGVAAVVAESFARIFYRNAINIGLPAVECPGISGTTEDGDTLEIEMARGIVTNVGNKMNLELVPMPRFMIEILEAGGLVAYLRGHMDEWMR